MILETGRFGHLEISDTQVISIPFGVFGFPNLTKYCLIDPGDDTLILWLQSLENPEIVFPVLEPKIFKEDYVVKLSAAEMRELRLLEIKNAAVLSILTIPDDIRLMTANLKAPLVINTEDQIAKQVVLQENEYSIKHAMFKELKSHLMTIASQKKTQGESAPLISLISVREMEKSMSVQTLG